MAGKNRSNVLAALLGNMDDLSGAYESALNAEGSAMQENEAYLNSIQGKIDQFNNSLQTMWMNALDSDMVKFFIDLGRVIVEAADNVGLLNAAMAGIFTFSALKSNSLGDFITFQDGWFKLGGSGQSVKNFGASIANGLSDFSFKDLGSKIKNTFVKDVKDGVEDAADEMADILESSFSNVTDDMQMDGLIDFTSSAADGMDDLSDAQKRQSASSKAAGAANAANAKKTKLVGVAAKAASVGVKLLNAALTFGIGLLVSFAIEKTIGWIDDLIHKQENLRESAKEVLDTYSDAKENANKSKELVDSVGSEYETLAKGVDAFGNNISLTSAQYERYHEICNQIAAQFPTMISGYDAEGNAILKNKGNVEALTAAYQEQAQAARQAAIAGADDVFNAFKGDYDNSAEWFWEKDTGLKQQVELAERLVSLIGDENIAGLSSFFEVAPGSSYSEKDLQNMLDSVGIDKNDVWNFSTGADLDALQKAMPKLQSYLKTSVAKVNAETSKVKTLMDAYLGEDLDYAKLDNRTQSAVDTIISSLDAETLNRFDSADALYAWIDANILDPFTDPNTSEAITEAYQNLLQPDMSGLNWAEYQKTIAKNREELWNAFGGDNNTLGENGTKMSEDDFFKMMGIEIPDTSVYEGKIKQALKDFKGMTEEQATNYINNLDPITVQRLFEVEWENVSEENIDEILNPIIEKGPTEIKTYSVLASDLEAYNTALSNTAELTVEGMQASDDYVTSLSSIGLTAEQVGKCIDTENGNIVTNVELLNKYVQNARKGVLENTRLAKSQSQLQYYELYKQMHELTNGTNQLTDAQREQVNAIYDQMNAIEQTITKYSMLEQEILGATNAYTQFEQAQAADSATDYISNTENMLSALIDGFNTGMVGTETFKAAIAGMVPESVYKDLDTVEEKMQAIYKYAKQDLGRYFTIGSDGSVDSTWDNMTNLIKDGRALGVFTGKDNNHIELSKDITSLKQFAEAFNLTEEAAYALLVNMEKMDGEWINGDNQSFLDQLDPNKLSTSIYETTSAMADLEHAMANGEVSVDEYNAKYQELSKTQSDNAKKAQESAAAWIDANNNYQTAYDKVKNLNDEIAQMKADGASEAEIQVKTDELAVATTELQQAVDAKSQLTEPSEVVIQLAIDSINGQIEQWKADNAELELKVTPKLIQDKNGEWTIPAEVKANLSEEEKKKVEDYLTLLNQKKQIEGSTTTEQDSTNDQLKETKSLLEEVTDTLDGMPDLNIDTKDSLESLKELASILKKISDGDYDVEAEIDAAINKSEKRTKETEKNKNKKQKTNTPPSEKTDGFISPTTVTGTSKSTTNKSATSKKPKVETPEPPEIDWDKAFEKVNEWGTGVAQGAQEFFGETVPKKAGEIWDGAEKKLQEVNDWGAKTAEGVQEFFNETVPQKANEIWSGAEQKFQQVSDWGSGIIDDGKELFGQTIPEAIDGVFASAPEAMGAAVENIEWFFTETIPSIFEGIGEKGAELKGKVQEFFTITIPQAWDEFWENARNVFDDVNNFGAELKDKVVEFFTKTIPEKWNEFWDNASDLFASINEFGSNLANKVQEFFTVTIPQKWSEFWDVASNVFATINAWGAELKNKVVEFFTTTIPEKWNGFWDSASNVFAGINEFGANLSNKVQEFFTITIPEKWNEFWESATDVFAGINNWGSNLADKVSSFFNETIPNLWEKFKAGFWGGYDESRTKHESEKANDTLKETGATDYTFNIESNNIDDVISQIQEAQKALNHFVNSDGTINIEAEGCEEAQVMLATLISKKQALETPAILQVDTSTSEADVQNVINLINEFKTNYNTLEIQTAVGGDTTQAQADLNTTIAALQQSSPEILAKLGVDPTAAAADINTAINGITPTLMVQAGVDATKVQEFQNEKHDTTGECTWENNAKAVETWMKKTLTKTGTVKWGNDTTNVKNKFTATGTVNWGNSGGVEVNGTAHSSGTAHASGDWGLPKSERNALVGELGQELVVDPNTGRYYTVGDHGAEFRDLPKDAIIFNHLQTKALLQNGYVTGRGKAFVTGNAHLTRIKPGSGGGSSSSSTKKNNKSSSSSKNNSNKNNSSSSQAVEDAAEQIVDFVEFKLENIEKDISKTNAEIEKYLDNGTAIQQKGESYNKLIELEKQKYEDARAASKLYAQRAAEALEEIPSEYREMAKNGAIEIKDFIGEEEGKKAEAIQKYRDWATKAADKEIEELEALNRISEIRVEYIQDIADDFGNLIDAMDSKMDVFQAALDLAEAKGQVETANGYKKLISLNQYKLNDLYAQEAEVQKAIKEGLANKTLKKGTDEWYEMKGLLDDIRLSIFEAEQATVEWSNAIRDIKWNTLDKILDKFDSIDSELSHLYDRFTDKDVVDEYGNWTDNGIAAMGMLAQQMELAKVRSGKLQKSINQLVQEQDKYGDDEFREKLAELKEEQWESIEAYEDAKDALIELNKTRVDAVKDGMEKEIDAYKELIDKKKEALAADKDLYDFEKNVKEKQKNISDIERKLMALSGDNSMSAQAQRKQLEAELAEARADLEDTYYERSISQQQDALDKEYEAYEERMNKEMELLDESLKNEEQIVSDSLEVVKNNTSTVLDEINTVSETYGISISNNVVSPWRKGSEAVSGFKTTFTDMSSKFTELMDLIIVKMEAAQNQAEKTAAAMLNMLERQEGGNTSIGSGVGNSYGNYSYSGGTYVKADVPGQGTVYVNVKDGKTQTPGLPTGTVVHTAGGSYQITGTKDDGSYTSVKVSSGSGSSKSSGGSSSSNGNGGSSSKNTSSTISNGDKVTVNADATNYAGNATGVKIPNAVKNGSYGDSSGSYTVSQTKGDQVLLKEINSWVKKSDVTKKYAKGTLGTKKDDFAWIDELGEELVLHAGSNGKLTYLTKGSSVIPSDLTQRLMDLAVDPTQVLENSRPVVNAPKIVNNDINIDMNIAEVVHIEHVDNENLPDLTKAVEKQMDNYMKKLNGQIRKYAR